ncbi:MAG: hypothetical protein ABIO55_00550 [Ginsengibacter sp.]
MKKLLILSLAVFLTDNLFAQTWNEWSRQKKTQKKYLVQQIAALQVYSDYLLKGYSIAKNGLNTIQSIKHGDFDLNSNYFISLVTVNSKIKHYKKVADIIAMEVSIAKYIGKAVRSLISNNQFTNKELGYFKDVFNKVLTDGAKNLDELYNVITNGTVQMNDDERIIAIDKIYGDMQDKKMFTISFSNDAAGLSIQRSNEEKNILISKKLNGLK